MVVVQSGECQLNNQVGRVVRKRVPSSSKTVVNVGGTKWLPILGYTFLKVQQATNNLG